ncbi:Cro/CI family transcriptional regulator [Pseudohongiella sp. O18]|uniref:Cro/CI family transcriptional regulator n=1 Tax=Pseudohongiella sp. O18 TaxID=2904248 RepID=UPI001F159B0E|nr:Cro/CI family transcriptional regulator [Pseudohongiella sp. O18]
MTDSQIIDLLGGTAKVASIFGIEPASVSGWRKAGIPAARKQTLCLLFPDKTPAEWGPNSQVEDSAA